MPQVDLPITNPSGLHARPAVTFVKAAATFACDLRVTNLTRDASRSARAKSVLGVMGLGVSAGHIVRLHAEGADAEEALAELAALVAAGLEEAAARAVDDATPA